MARPGKLLLGELLWRDSYDYLRDHGYLLRERYKPDWIPSWQWKNDRSWRTALDGQRLRDTRVADAIRLKDGAVVAIKTFDLADNPTERDVATKFNSPRLASDPRNHCMPVYDFLPIPSLPGAFFMVTPLLRTYDSPPFETIGEVVAFWEQMFEGLHFMHLNNTVHRDCTNNNMMLDPGDMYPDSFHHANPDMRRDLKHKAAYFTRTQRPPRYYLIDYGLAIDYDSPNLVRYGIGSSYDPKPRAYPTEGGDKSAPEFNDHPGELHDPFPTDVYYLGNWIRVHFMQKYEGFDFMCPVVDAMTRRAPAERPTMEEAATYFALVEKTLDPWTLRTRPARRNEGPIERVLWDVWHLLYRARAAWVSAPLIPRPETARSDGPAILPAEFRAGLPVSARC